MTEENIKNLKKDIGEGKNSMNELKILMNQYKTAETPEERKMISSQINLLRGSLKKSTQEVSKNIENTSVVKLLNSSVTQKSVKDVVNDNINIRTGFQNLPKPQSKKELR